MNACLPVTEYSSMTLAAEIIRSLKRNKLPVSQSQLVPVSRVMTVKTPSLLLRMVQFDVLMKIKLSSIQINFQISMTFRTREYVL